MGNPKQKWTSEEEEALRAGVRKHGTGKWKDIQKDPEFNPHLANRSNIDLKDKWRNMSVATQGPREKPKSKSKETPATLFAGPQPSAASAAAAAASTAAAAVTVAIAPTKHEPATVPVKREPATVPSKREPATAPVKGEPVTVEESTGISETITAPECNAMIFEALNSAESKGMDTSSIASFIEQRNEVPQNFRKVLSTRLRRLVQQEKLEKVQNCFKIKSAPSRETPAPPTPIQKDSLPVHKQNDAPPVPKPNDVQPKQLQSPADVIDKISSETVEDAAVQAAYRIAEAENKSFVAEEAVKESERVSRMFDDTNSMLQLAEEFLKKCSQGEVVLIS